MMILRLCFFLFLLSVVSCKTSGFIKDESIEKSSISNEIESGEYLVSPLSVDKVELRLDYDLKRKESNNLYNVNYIVEFYTSGVGFLSCSLYDETGNVLYEESLIKISGKNKSTIIQFSDYFFHNNIRYKVLLRDKSDSINEVSGILSNNNWPDMPEVKFGPIVSQDFQDERETSLLINCEFDTKGVPVDFIRVIPPSEAFYWDLIYEIDSETNILISNGKVKFSEHNLFVENGIYVVQISLGQLGIVQKEFKIIDIYQNIKGPNYGFMVPVEKNNNKNLVELNIDDIDLVESMDFVFFIKTESVTRQIGTYKILNPSEIISKKDLLSGVEDETGTKVKINFNKEYYYQIIVYTKEINGMKYISSSEMNKIIFYGFGLFNF